MWFDTNAEEAVSFYLSVFKDSSIKKITYYGKEGYEVHKMPEGTVMTIDFELDGSPFLALNGGPVFKFNEAVSFVINCEGQDEIDYYWDRLTEGGDEKSQQCGWLKDKYGLSWQVTPTRLDEMMADEDREAAGRVMNAMLKMKKLDLPTLEAAYEGSEVKQMESTS